MKVSVVDGSAQGGQDFLVSAEARHIGDLCVTDELNFDFLMEDYDGDW